MTDADKRFTLWVVMPPLLFYVAFFTLFGLGVFERLEETGEHWIAFVCGPFVIWCALLVLKNLRRKWRCARRGHRDCDCIDGIDLGPHYYGEQR